MVIRQLLDPLLNLFLSYQLAKLSYFVIRGFVELTVISVFVDNYVHRLVASKTDGKMVQYECEGDTCHAEKIDALQLEVKPFSFPLFCFF